MAQTNQDRPSHYILEGKDAKPASLMEWAKWLEAAGKDRQVVVTDISDDVRVSTVFLGLDHNYLDTGPPLIFETLIFGGEHNGDMDRYSTYEEAEAGHEVMVKRVRS